MFVSQYGIGTLCWKRDDSHFAFSFESHRKEHSPCHHLYNVFLWGGIQKPYSADLSYIRAQNPPSSF